MNRRKQTRSAEVAAVFKALGHPSRTFIVETLARGERCVCELSEMVGADVSTVSRHLALLREAGIVVSRKEGTTVYYSLACNCLGQMIDGVENVIRMKAERKSAALVS